MCRKKQEEKQWKRNNAQTDDHHVNRLILLCIGFRHMWHRVSDSAHFEHALCPHRNATFHAFSRHIEHMCDSSNRSILYRSSISCAASIDSSKCRLISRPPANNTLSSQMYNIFASRLQWYTVTCRYIKVKGTGEICSTHLELAISKQLHQC